MNTPTFFELTRWRDLDNPISPLDPIQPGSPRYEAWHIPPCFVVLLWDGMALVGPMQFPTQADADQFLSARRCDRAARPIQQYLIIPKP